LTGYPQGNGAGHGAQNEHVSHKSAEYVTRSPAYESPFTSQHTEVSLS